MTAPNTSQNATADAYLRTRVLTASPEQLRLLLIEGAIKFLRQGRDGLARKDFEASFNGFSKCRDILLELMNSMRPELAPELCTRVGGLYTFMYSQVVEAGLERDIAKADKVIELLEYERETWLMVMDTLARERAMAAEAQPALAPQQVPEREHRPLSVQG